MVKRDGGWTLIEVLVVLAIILVLVALIYAIGAFAIDRAHQAGCISNLRQIGMALQQYMEDYKRGDWDTEVDSYAGIADQREREQLVARWGFPSTTLYQLYEGGYLKDRRLLLCPKSKISFDVQYEYHHPATWVRIPPYFMGRVNTWEDFLWVLRQRKWEYSIVADFNHTSRGHGIGLLLRMDGRVDRRVVTPFDLQRGSHVL